MPGIRTDGGFPAVASVVVARSTPTMRLQKRKTRVRLDAPESARVFQRKVQKVRIEVAAQSAIDPSRTYVHQEFA